MNHNSKISPNYMILLGLNSINTKVKHPNKENMSVSYRNINFFFNIQKWKKKGFINCTCKWKLFPNFCVVILLCFLYVMSVHEECLDVCRAHSCLWVWRGVLLVSWIFERERDYWAALVAWRCQWPWPLELMEVEGSGLGLCASVRH